MAWDDEEYPETGGPPDTVTLVGEPGSVSSKMVFTIIQEQNSWRIKATVTMEGHPIQVMLMDAWYPSKFAAVQDLPMVVNAANGKGWVTAQ